ncbi:MAG: radical SAM protein, partial [Bacteroidales bacterium]
MASIYIHVPYCKQLCYYCNFYFSLNTKTIDEYINALKLDLQKSHNFITDKTIDTIYFGGGTPTLLHPSFFQEMIDEISKYFHLQLKEITIEANPDDINQDYVNELLKTPVNRVSLGIQTFDENLLNKLNRRHTSTSSHKAILLIKNNFSNYTIDLLFAVTNNYKILENDLNEIKKYMPQQPSRNCTAMLRLFLR